MTASGCGDALAGVGTATTDLSLWVDDCKPAPAGCAVARTFDDALRMLRRYDYQTLYLDHDLGEERTGYDLLGILIEENRVPPRVECISWNPVGRARILAALRDFRSSSFHAAGVTQTLPDTTLGAATARITELESLLSQMREALRKMTFARDQAMVMTRRAEAGEPPNVLDLMGIAPELADDWPTKETLPPSSYGTP